MKVIKLLKPSAIKAMYNAEGCMSVPVAILDSCVISSLTLYRSLVFHHPIHQYLPSGFVE